MRHLSISNFLQHHKLLLAKMAVCINVAFGASLGTVCSKSHPTRVWLRSKLGGQVVGCVDLTKLPIHGSALSQVRAFQIAAAQCLVHSKLEPLYLRLYVDGELVSPSPYVLPFDHYNTKLYENTMRVLGQARSVDIAWDEDFSEALREVQTHFEVKHDGDQLALKFREIQGRLRSDYLEVGVYNNNMMGPKITRLCVEGCSPKFWDDFDFLFCFRLSELHLTSINPNSWHIFEEYNLFQNLTKIEFESLDLEACPYFPKLEHAKFYNCGLNRPDDFSWLPETLLTLDCDSGNKIDLCDNIKNFSKLTLLRVTRSWAHRSLPTGIGDLAQLDTLDLHDFNLKGQIVPQVCKLSRLTCLDLHKNRLTGIIPAQVAQLASLEKLDLSANKLSGILPSELGCLAHLFLLDVHANRLSGRIPSELGQSKVEALNLSYNNLGGTLPSELGNMTGLVKLECCYNCLSGLIPEAIWELESLEVLDLSHNRLEVTVPTKPSTVKRLEEFDVHANNIEASVAEQIADLRGESGCVDDCRYHCFQSDEFDRL